MTPSIWVVGQQHVGKHDIAQSVAGLRCEKAGLYAWKIDTKYYTAEVNLHAFRFSQLPPEGQNPEAIVVIIDATDESSFTQARAWTERAEWNSAEIKLMVANKVDQLCRLGCEPARPDWLLRVIEWCTDNCCEYIEAAPKFPSVDAALVFDGEPQGVARVVAALQAHMWPGMSRKAGGASAHSVNTPPSAAQEREPPAAAQDKELMEPQDTGAPAVPKASSSVLPTPAAAYEVSGLSEEEDRVDAFEQIFQELQGARERFADLPDDKRRQAAAALAMRMASLLDTDSDAENDAEGRGVHL